MICTESVAKITFKWHVTDQHVHEQFPHEERKTNKVRETLIATTCQYCIMFLQAPAKEIVEHSL